MEARVKATATLDSRKLAYAIANACEGKKGVGTIVMDVRDITLITDFFVIAGGESAAQVRAIVESIEDNLNKVGCPAKTIEGKRDGRWVLVDCGDVIVHVLQERDRSYYKLEQFWNQALIVDRSEWLQV